VLHSGYEYIEAPSPQQSTISRAALEAGADIVIGHHAHLLQGVEFNERGVIVYGLGNFAFEIDGPPDTAILNVWMDQQGVRQIEFVPAIVQFGGQPRIANDLEKSRILDHIYRLTDALN
jgi:poly-gamma-glutamate synthesis protein (capsule biosynthesis protein)